MEERYKMLNKKFISGVLLGMICLVSLVSALVVVSPDWDSGTQSLIWFTSAQNASWTGQSFNTSYNGTFQDIGLELYCYDSQNATFRLYV